MAGLREREGNLQNFSYTLRQWRDDVRKGSPTTAPVAMYESYNVQFARLGPKTLLTGTSYADDGQKEGVFHYVWDGTVMKALGRSDGAAEWRLVINDESDRGIKDIAYNYLLGYRFTGTAMTTSEWIADQITRRRCPYSIEEATEQRMPLLRVRIDMGEANRFMTLWLDPDRNFLTVRGLYEVHRTNYEANANARVLQAAQKDGVWVPLSVVVRVDPAGKGLVQDYHAEVKAFSVGTVKDADFELQIPPHTVVLDMIHRRNYVVGAHGGKQEKSYYDPLTGKVTPPGASSQPTN